MNASSSPDGHNNYGNRSVPTVITGLNTTGALDTPEARKMNPGDPFIWFFVPDQPPLKAHEWNLLIERELFHDTVVRLGYTGTHGSNLDQYWAVNDNIPDYIWFTTTGLPKPTGTYSNTAQRVYDQTTWMSMSAFRHTGWSNANSFRIEAERRFSRGVGFQFFYVMNNAMNAGGDGAYMAPPAMFMPGTVPTDDQERNRFLSYHRDNTVPKHRLRWNWLVDLPFGRGKKFGGNAGGFLDRVIGGWQIAGLASTRSNYFALPDSWWGPTSNVEVYGNKYPIEDCRSGTCFQGYLYYNGYIPANQINSYGANGKPNGVMGVPANYHPVTRPLMRHPRRRRQPHRSQLPVLRNQQRMGPTEKRRVPTHRV